MLSVQECAFLIGRAVYDEQYYVELKIWFSKEFPDNYGCHCHTIWQLLIYSKR